MQLNMTPHIAKRTVRVCATFCEEHPEMLNPALPVKFSE
jgi:hypothetical protein